MTALAGADDALARYLKPNLLIVDDMGLKQLPEHSGEYLFETILRRYQEHSTIVTSNRPLEEWGRLIGDVLAATSILRDHWPQLPPQGQSPPERGRRLHGKQRRCPMTHGPTNLDRPILTRPYLAGLEATRDSQTQTGGKPATGDR